MLLITAPDQPSIPHWNIQCPNSRELFKALQTCVDSEKSTLFTHMRSLRIGTVRDGLLYSLGGCDALGHMLLNAPDFHLVRWRGCVGCCDVQLLICCASRSSQLTLESTWTICCRCSALRITACRHWR